MDVFNILINWLGFMFSVILGALIGASLLRIATKIVCRFNLPYGIAIRHFLFVFLINCAIWFVLACCIAFAGMNFMGSEEFQTISQFVGNLLGCIVSFCVISVLWGLVIKNPNHDQPIGIGRGFLVSLVLVAMWIVIFCVFKVCISLWN